MIERLVEEMKRRGENVFTVVEMTDDGTKKINVNSAPDAHYAYSITKCYTAAAIGILYDRNIISDEDYIYPMFKDLFMPSHDPKWETVKIKDVLQHRSGFARGYINYKDEDESLFFTDPLKIMFAYDLGAKVGEEMIYNEPNYYLLARIVELKTGKTLFDFCQEEFFNPMRCEDYSWSVCPFGHNWGGSGLTIRTVDMAKLGWMYLNGGIYGDKRYLSEEWIKKATATRVVDPSGEYGYAVLRKAGSIGDYYFQGAFGQLVNINTVSRRVIAFNGFGVDNNYYIDIMREWEQE